MLVKTKVIVAGVTTCTLFALGLSNSVKADENMAKMYDHFDDKQRVLYFPDSGFANRHDGSGDFTPLEISQSGGEVITVADAREKARKLPTFPDRYFITEQHARTILPGRSRRENVSGGGWQTSRYCYNAGLGNGPYLQQETYGDSGLAGDTAIYPGSPKYVYSDVNRETAHWGIYYKTYNAPYGTYFEVRNWQEVQI